MIKVGIAGTSILDKIRIADQIRQHLETRLIDLQYLPDIVVEPLGSLEFNLVSEFQLLVVIESSAFDREIDEIKNIIDIPIFLYTERELTLAEIYNYSQEISDFLVSSRKEDWLTKIILHKKLATNLKKGKLVIVESAKHGLGCTTIVAALSEGLSASGNTVMVDSDFFSQDLSRFLQVKPFVNELLSSVLMGEITLTQNLVDELINKIWEKENCFLMTPALFPIENEQASKLMIRVIEYLLNKYDYVLLDITYFPEIIKERLRRTADRIILLISPDPSKLIASLKHNSDKLSKYGDKLLIINNQLCDGLTDGELQKHFKSGKYLSLGFSHSGNNWLASGYTIFSLGNKKTVKQLKNIISQIVMLDKSNKGKTEIEEDVRTSKEDIKLLPHFAEPIWT